MVATRSSTKRAEMTDQQAATSAATGEQSQQPAMADNMNEFMARQQAERDAERAERGKSAAERDAQQVERDTQLRAEWAERDARQRADWADQTASLGKETSQWRDTIDMRLKRLESGESAQTVPSESSDTGESSDPIPVIVPAVKGGMRQRPPKYDGKTDWGNYRMQFEIVAQLNEWGSVEKAAFLATSLEGSAANILGGIPADRRQDYAVLVAALEMRFGTAIQKELNRVKLRSRRRQRGEPLVEMADDIERLARLAYDDAPTATQDTHAKEQFIDAMTDDDLRLRVLQSRPTSLRDALRSALELESFTLAVRRTPTVRTVSDAHNNAKSENDLPKLIGDMFERFSASMTQLVNGGRSQRPPPRTNRWVQPRGNCWNCGDMGHFRNACPFADNSCNQREAAATNANRQRDQPPGEPRSRATQQRQEGESQQPWAGNGWQPTSGAEGRL